MYADKAIQVLIVSLQRSGDHNIQTCSNYWRNDLFGTTTNFKRHKPSFFIKDHLQFICEESWRTQTKNSLCWIAVPLFREQKAFYRESCDIQNLVLLF